MLWPVGRAETPSRKAPEPVTTRTAPAGWVAWGLFILTAVMVTATALIDRYRGYCPGPGEAGRDWAFELIPFGQTCVVEGLATLTGPVAIVQTVVIYLTLVVALSASAFVLASSRFGTASRLARSLVIAQVASVVLAGVVVIVQLMVNDSPPALVGVDLGLVWNLVLAFAVATAISVITFLISTFVKLGRTTG